jgi:hypothetical protein
MTSARSKAAHHATAMRVQRIKKKVRDRALRVATERGNTP